MWWLSGIHRHVRLYSKPRSLAIVDFHVATAVLTPRDAQPQYGEATLAIDVRCDGQAIASASSLVGRANGAGAADPADTSRGAVHLASYTLVASVHGPCLIRPNEPPPPRPELWRASQPLSRDGHAVAAAVPGAAPLAAEVVEAGGLLTGAASATFRAELPGAALWSAEAPWLYTIVLALYDADGTYACACRMRGHVSMHAHGGARPVRRRRGHAVVASDEPGQRPRQPGLN